MDSIVPGILTALVAGALAAPAIRYVISVWRRHPREGPSARPTRHFLFDEPSQAEAPSFTSIDDVTICAPAHKSRE